MPALPGYKGFLVTIDYKLTLEEMIKACGFADCDYAEFIAERFEVSGIGVVQQEIVLIEFDARIILRDFVVEGMMALGLEPAKIEHALALGKQYPEVQRERPVVFFGSTWHSYAPTLGNWTDGRRIRCDCWRNGYYSENRFAAVRKIPNAVS